MEMKSRGIEREHEGCLELSLKSAFTQLHTLRSLKTATKKRRALKRESNRSVLTKSSPSMRGERTQRSA
jgi:hypothetical protein